MIEAMMQHLASGATTLCRCWRISRRDGRVMGFTDHDRDLVFADTVFRASDGLNARAMDQTTGLAVDNSEAMGALNDAGITEADIVAGRYDGARVEAWLVDWSRVETRVPEFRGEIGEIERSGGAFRAELRGLSERLNRPLGHVYQGPCSAMLGDTRCGKDLSGWAYSARTVLAHIEDDRVFGLEGIEGYEAGHFTGGRLIFVSGSAKGLAGVIKRDLGGQAGAGDVRTLVLAESLRALPEQGDEVRVIVGCDKRTETCRSKFDNIRNFRGFPHLPSEDWLLTYPVGNGGGAS